MQIVAVMDLKAGQVVRGVAGRRDEYRPVESVLCHGADPATLGRAFIEQLDLHEVYVADLDALAGTEPAWDVYRALGECGLDVWIDAGLSDLGRARDMAALRASGVRVSGIIAALESVSGPDLLADIVGAVGQDRAVFSLDLMDGRPITDSPGWRGLTVDEILSEALRAGIERIIVLDLACVGVNAGVGTKTICRQLRRRAPKIQIMSGGGVRGIDDVRALSRAGCNSVLVSSALHDGRITRDDVRRVMSEGSE